MAEVPEAALTKPRPSPAHDGDRSPVETLDLLSGDFAAVAFEHYARLRGAGHVVRIQPIEGPEIWLITRFEDARAALTDRRLSKDLAASEEALVRAGVIRPQAVERVQRRNLLSIEPPDHTRLRRMVSRAFSPRRIAGLHSRIEEITHELLDAVAAAGRAELIADVADPLPRAVITELLGVPRADSDRLHAWVSTRSLPSTGDNVRVREEAALEQRRYLRDLVLAIRGRADPDVAEDDQPDLVSALIAAADEHDRLSEDEVIDMLNLLLNAGQETVTNLIGNAVLALLRHPTERDRLTGHPEALVAAVEEFLRYDGADEQATGRVALEEIEVGGVTIPRHALVHIGLASANHDPARFEDPERFDIGRPRTQHLAFGHGHHVCLGAPLARMEVRIAIGAILDRFPDLALDGPESEIRWRPRSLAGVARGLVALPLRFTPAPALLRSTAGAKPVRSSDV
jgi:cytochrome P450